MGNLKKIDISEWGGIFAGKKKEIQVFFVVLFVLLEEQTRETWKMLWLRKMRICTMREVKLESNFKR